LRRIREEALGDAKMHTQLLILGGGPGGYAAAFLAADLGMEVTLVDEEPRLGGTCLLRGCIPSKALLHVARVLAEARELSDWGVSFATPNIDIAAMRARKNRAVAKLSKGLGQLAKRRKVSVVHARGRLLDAETLALEGGEPADRGLDRITFDHCIVATGSRPAAPAALRLPTERVMDSTGALELADVPAALLVVGGGIIGLEMASVYAELGSAVTIVELTEGLLPGVDRDLVKPLARRLEQRMAAIHLGVHVTGLLDLGDQVEATFGGPGADRSGRFNRVLVATGRRPASSGIGLENTAVQVDQRGFVVVDCKQQTADPRILAVGDVAGEPMLAHKAAHQGKVAVEVIAGGPAAFEPRAIPSVVYTDPEIAWAGVTQEQAGREGLNVAVAQFPWQASGRAVTMGRTDGLTKWLIDPTTDGVVGAGIVGIGAGELIAEAVLAIEMGCTVRDVADSIHPHPTMSETMAFASEIYLGTATDVYRPKRKP